MDLFILFDLPSIVLDIENLNCGAYYDRKYKHP